MGWVRNFVGTAMLLGACGCAKNPYVLEGQVKNLQRDQQGLAQRNTDLNSRAQLLDSEHQDLQARLAQSLQQERLLEDKVKALQNQLASSSDQIARLRDDQKNGSRSTFTSSSGARPQASIRANNSLRGDLPRFNLPGVEVRADADVVRIELSGAQLFDSGDARLRAGAGPMMDEVVNEIVRRYPEQMIGIEGHTDSDPLRPQSPWPSNHQLSVGRATSVYEYLVQRTRLKPQQLFIVGHGSNHPVVSNATEPGKQRNRRVELVVYPELMPR